MVFKTLLFTKILNKQLIYIQNKKQKLLMFLKERINIAEVGMILLFSFIKIILINIKSYLKK